MWPTPAEPTEAGVGENDQSSTKSVTQSDRDRYPQLDLEDKEELIDQVCVYVCMYVYMYVCMWGCMYCQVCVGVCMYVCLYVCTCVL